MKQTLIVLLAAACCADAQPKKNQSDSQPVPIEAPTPPSTLSPKQRRNIEFQGDETRLALRTLARQAKINVVIADRVGGTVTMRIEDKTPMEAIEIICTAKGLTCVEEKGVLHIDDPNGSGPSPDKTSGQNVADPLEKALTEMLTPGLIASGTRLYDTLLDVQARPETAKKTAKAKKLFFDALMEEGFTRDEALKIVIFSDDPDMPNFNP
jgi:hypothetical protein